MTAAGLDAGARRDRIEVVVAHDERMTVRIGDRFVKIDADADRLDREAVATTAAPIPAPTVLWRQPGVLAISALAGSPLGRLGAASEHPAAAWRTAGETVRTLHDAAPPPWPRAGRADVDERLDTACAWIADHDAVPRRVLERNRRHAESALDAWKPVFAHGDLQPEHVFIAGGRVSGVLDWSEAGLGDAGFDLATLTLGVEQHLRDVLAGYGGGVDIEVVRAGWSLRSLLAIPWLSEHGFDPALPGCEIDVLLARA